MEPEANDTLRGAVRDRYGEIARSGGGGCCTPASSCCGSPATAPLAVDLGAGAGVDCFLASRRVGGSGRVIGVDMTSDMVSRARANARQGGHDHVEFRLGEIEAWLAAAGFTDIAVQPSEASREVIRDWLPGHDLGRHVASATIEAVKPAV